MAQAHHKEEHIDAGHSTRFYWIIGAFLAVITVAEVLVTFLPMPAILLLAILMVMMVVKGACVVMFFMHLRGDARIFQFVFISPLLIATTMILAFLVLFSRHVGIAG